MMVKKGKSKLIATCLIFSFILFYSPYLLVGQSNKIGSLTGYIYAEDGTTPVEGAVVKVRNISSGSVYESNISNKLGLFQLGNIEEGLYTVGITTKNGGFNVKNIIGVKANEMAKVSFALRPLYQEEAAVKVTKECPRGEWYYPDAIGECYIGYRWNPKTLRCECEKRKGIGAFLASPIGIAVVIAATAAGIYGIVKLTEEEEEASPFK